MIVGIVNEKGGTGKSTIAVNLAIFSLFDQKKVLLVDADPQKSVLNWGDLRRENKKEEKGLVIISRTGKALDREIAELSANFDITVIDTGGRDSVEMRKTMLIADVLIIPVIPSQFDAWSLEKTLQLFSEAFIFNQKVIAFVVMNKVPFLLGWQKREIKEMREFLEEIIKDYENVKIAQAYLIERTEYKKSITEGLSVYEIKEIPGKENKAKQEFLQLYEEIFKKIKKGGTYAT